MKRQTLSIIVLLFQWMAYAGPCEGVFSDPADFAKAMTENLMLKEGQYPLLELYFKEWTPYPQEMPNQGRQRIYDFINRHPEISKPVFREQILEFPIAERNHFESLKNFIRSFRKSAGKIRNSLFQVEANLGFWIKMLGFSKKNQQDFIAYLNTTALNQKTRAFIKDESQPYRERVIKLYKAMEQIKADLSNKQTEKNPQDLQNLSQAMVNLIYIVGIENKAWVEGLKSKDPQLAFSALQNILNERDIIAFNLGFEGHFKELKEVLGSQIPDEKPLLQAIKKDIENHLVIKPVKSEGKETLRLRALSLIESPFRSCMGGDCASQSYFEKALDPNFVYWTLTDTKHKSSGQVTVVLGTALNQKQEEVRVAFIDKIQKVPIQKLKAMLEGIRLSLNQKGYLLVLPKDVGGDTASDKSLSDEAVVRSYVAKEILPTLKKEWNNFKPHEHEYNFYNGIHSRAEDLLELLQFEDPGIKRVSIKVGPTHQAQLANPHLTAPALYGPILQLEKSTKEEDQLKFLTHLLTLKEIKEFNISDQHVQEHLALVITNHQFAFEVRKKAFYTLMEFELLLKVMADNMDFPNFAVLKKWGSLFSKREQKVLIGEMSNWRNTLDYRKKFVHYLTTNQLRAIKDNGAHLKQALESSYGILLDKDLLLIRLIAYHKSQHLIALVKELLDRGADPNFIYQNQTPLMWGATHNYIDIVKELLDRGADPNITTMQGRYSALRLAKDMGHIDIIKELSGRGAI